MSIAPGSRTQNQHDEGDNWVSLTFSRSKEGYLLRAEMQVPLPLSQVFEFFSRAENLERITPPRLRFEIVSPRPIEMRVGALIDYRIKVHGFPLRWQSEITKWDPPHSFIDEQRRGPYKLWKHEHRFEERAGETVVIDEVLYDLLFGSLVHPIFVKPDLKAIFEFRQEAIRRELL